MAVAASKMFVFLEIIWKTKKQLKGAYIKYVGGVPGGFYKFFKKNVVALKTLELNISWPSIFFENISWPLPSVVVSYLRLSCSSISG